MTNFLLKVKHKITGESCTDNIKEIHFSKIHGNYNVEFSLQAKILQLMMLKLLRTK